MQRQGIRYPHALALAVLCAGLAARADDLALFDTGTRAAAPLPGETLLARTGWTQVKEGEKPSSFKGDAVLANGRMAVVLRAKGDCAEAYGVTASSAVLRARLVPVLDGTAPAVGAVKVTANEADGITLEAAFQGAGGKKGAVAYALQPGSPICKSTPAGAVTGQRTEAPCRLGVLPDFFADDMVVDARAIPVARAEIPGENFFMHMLGNGNAIVTVIWDKGSGDVPLTLNGEQESRVIAASEVGYGAGGAIWTSVLEQPGIWATCEIATNTQKNSVSLDWKPAFPAKWKGDFMRVDHTVDSWPFEYNPGKRTRWSGVGGSYNYPCWFEGKDAAVKAFCQPATTFPNARFHGPFVAYPIERDSSTPLDRFTVTDLMKNSLGVGPCEYITDVAGQGVKNRGIFTCAVADMTPALFHGNLQKEERVFLRKMLEQTQVFVKVIGERINAYVAFRQETLKYLGEQKKAHPELADFIGRLEKQTQTIHGQRVDNAANVSNVVVRIEAMAMADRPGAAERADLASRLTEEECGGSIAAYGGWQDGVVAKCRNSVKMLRQMASVEMAVNPASAEVAREVRKRTQQALRGMLGHEM
jgi:hypothetical protein